MNIHLIGIGGTGMASLAGLLVEAGHIVTGSDGKIYEPMGGQLSALGITPYEGYSAENITRAHPDLVIIGNVIRRENPEAQEALRQGIKYMSMPEALSDFFLKNRTPIVVAGTHGKTTVSTLLAWLLRSCKINPGFLIGGIGINFGKSYSVGKDPFFVVEGDEYDTAFFDKGPKFLHYRPKCLVLTSIEFDHADIYRDLNHILDSFKRLLSIIPPDGIVVANADDANVKSLIGSADCRVVTYGADRTADYSVKKISADSKGTSFSMGNDDQRFIMPMWGEHNLLNAAGSLAMLLECRQDIEKLSSGLMQFKGVKRRQEIVAELKGVTIIDDFAHHPTAVRKTIESMRTRFPGHRIWAIFEPRSNTSRRNIFQKEYADALSAADRAIIARPYREDMIPVDERLDVDFIASEITRRGIDAHSITRVEHIVEFIMRGIDRGDVLLVMSNGSFDNMCQKLMDAVGKRKIITDKNGVVPSRVPK